MKKIFILLLCVLCFGANSAAVPAKIGVVDMDEVFSVYDRAEGISEKVRAIAREGALEREKLRGEISALERRLREAPESLTRREAEELEQSLREKVGEYRDFDREQKEKEARPVHEALGHIYERVESYAAENGFGLVIEKRMGLFGRTVLFADESFDITEEIINLLQRQNRG